MLRRRPLAVRKELHMKVGESKAKPKGKYANNPELRKVAKALRAFVKDIEPATKETVNCWGVPTFENDSPFCLYWSARITSPLDSFSVPP
jgi:hypothetical protein